MTVTYAQFYLLLTLLFTERQHILSKEEMLKLLMNKKEKFHRLCFRLKLGITLLSILAATFSLGAVALRLSPSAFAAEEESVKLPILMYHAIMSDKTKAGDYVITPQDFRHDMEYIKEAGYNTVVMEDIISYVQTGAPLPENPVMITLDDGYYNNYLYAYPVLEELGQRAVLSVLGVEADRYTNEPDMHENYAHSNWDQLREMHESGVIELQNHSYDMHHIMKGYMGIGMKSGEEITAYRTRLYTDLSQMQSRFQDELGIVPNTFTFPFGTAPADSSQVLRELGFLASLGTDGRTNYLTRDESSLQLLARYNRTNKDTAQSILEKA